MKKNILAGIIIAGALATSAAQAATLPTVEEIYSGMSSAAIQKDQEANPAAERYSAGKATCNWHQETEVIVDQLHAPYPGTEDSFGEKDYLAASNTKFTC